MSELRFDHMCYLQITYARLSNLIDEYSRVESLTADQRVHKQALKDLKNKTLKQINTHG